MQGQADLQHRMRRSVNFSRIRMPGAQEMGYAGDSLAAGHLRSYVGGCWAGEI